MNPMEREYLLYLQEQETTGLSANTVKSRIHTGKSGNKNTAYPGLIRRKQGIQSDNQQKAYPGNELCVTGEN